MSITLLFGCCQIETCARDLDAVRKFFVEVLGGVLIEQDLAHQISELIPGNAYEVDHIDVGHAVFQINRPSPAMSYGGSPSVHQRYLDEYGPCITNLNWFVDDIEHARALLAGMGAKTLIEGPSNVASSLGDYGPDNTREGSATRPFLFMGTRHLIGFDLEIMEPNFRHFSQQTVQYPAFIKPRPASPSDLRLHRLVVSVPSLRTTFASLVEMFAPASRSKPYQVNDRTEQACFRIGLGGIEIEFHQDEGAAPHTGVFATAFGTNDPDSLLKRSEQYGLVAKSCPSANQPHWRIESRSLVGFDILVEPAETPLPF